MMTKYNALQALEIVSHVAIEGIQYSGWKLEDVVDFWEVYLIIIL